MTTFDPTFDPVTVGEKLDQLVALTEANGPEIYAAAKRIRAEVEAALLARRPGWWCDVCWSSSFSPCPEGAKHAIPDPNRPGEFMVCELCTTHEWALEAKRSNNTTNGPNLGAPRL